MYHVKCCFNSQLAPNYDLEKHCNLISSVERKRSVQFCPNSTLWFRVINSNAMTRSSGNGRKILLALFPSHSSGCCFVYGDDDDELMSESKWQCVCVRAIMVQETFNCLLLTMCMYLTFFSLALILPLTNVVATTKHWWFYYLFINFRMKPAWVVVADKILTHLQINHEWFSYGFLRYNNVYEFEFYHIDRNF